MSKVDPREYLDESFDRQRLGLELRRSGRPAVTVLIGLAVALMCALFIASNVAPSIYRSHQTVTFEVESVRAVVPGVQEAKVKGIPAGKITEAELVEGRAFVTIEIDRKYGPIYRDARARLAPDTVLQDMSLDVVDPGTEAAGEAGAEPLPIEQTGGSVDVSRVLQTFQEQERERLRGLLRDLGAGVEDRGEELRRSFVKVVPFLQAVDRLAGEIAERDHKTQRLIGNVSKLTEELATREKAMRGVVSNGAATLDALAERATELEQTIAELPPTLTELDRAFTAVDGVVDDVDGALLALGPVARELPSGLAGLRNLSDVAAPTIRKLREPVRELDPFVGALRPISGSLRRALRSLDPVPRRLDSVTRVVADCRYAVERFFQWTPSVFKATEARGVAPRAFVTTGLGAIPGGTTDPNVSASDSCAPGGPIGSVPGPGGSR